MASIQFADGTTNWKGESASGAGRVTLVQRGNGYSLGAMTGTMAAALAANAAVFAMRYDPGAGSLRAFVEVLTLEFTTIVAFTTPVTAGRRLAVYRASGANTSGGTAITEMPRLLSTDPASQFDTAEGGDVRIASTGALTVTGVTFEAQPFAFMFLTHVGAAGAYATARFEADSGHGPLILEPGQLLVVRNGPSAMDAAGTWQLNVNAQWREASLLSA